MAISSWLGRGECRKGEENEENERKKERKKGEEEELVKDEAFGCCYFRLRKGRSFLSQDHVSPIWHLPSHSSDIKKLLSCCDNLVFETAFKTETKSVGFSFFPVVGLLVLLWFREKWTLLSSSPSSSAYNST
jgi:hypothetical protein